jgi:hypothetical protein
MKLYGLVQTNEHVNAPRQVKARARADRSVAQAGPTQLVPIGITKLYEAINSGAIESSIINNRRWINYQSLKKFAGIASVIAVVLFIIGEPTMSTRADADELASIIESYWHRLGHRTVKCGIELVHFQAPHRDGSSSHADVTYVVKSNLVNGLPPGITGWTSKVRA